MDKQIGPHEDTEPRGVGVVYTANYGNSSTPYRHTIIALHTITIPHLHLHNDTITYKQTVVIVEVEK